MQSLSLFQPFVKASTSLKKVTGMNAVLYTRVSSKEQENNFSLPLQRKICEEFAKKAGYEVIAFLEELLKVLKPMSGKNLTVCSAL